MWQNMHALHIGSHATYANMIFFFPFIVLHQNHNRHGAAFVRQAIGIVVMTQNVAGVGVDHLHLMKKPPIGTKKKTMLIHLMFLCFPLTQHGFFAMIVEMISKLV